MKCVSENILDRIILEQGEHTGKYCAELEHIDACNFCQSRYRSLMQFYKDLASGGQQISSDKLDTLMASIWPIDNTGVTYSLSQVLPVPDYRISTSQTDSKLAAASEVGQTEGSIINRGVFATSDNDLRIRVLEDELDKTISLNLISTTLRTNSGLLISIPEQGIEQVSDAYGRVKINAHELNITKDLVINVITPKAAWELTKVYPNLLDLVDQGTLTLSDDGSERVRIDISTNDKQYALRILLEHEVASGMTRDIKVSISKGNKWLLRSGRHEDGIHFEGIDDLTQLRIHIF